MFGGGQEKAEVVFRNGTNGYIWAIMLVREPETTGGVFISKKYKTSTRSLSAMGMAKTSNRPQEHPVKEDISKNKHV